MTLIAIACKGDTAEILTDSLSYTKNLGKLSHTSKCLVLPHLDAALLSQGDSVFGIEAKAFLAQRSALPGSFDSLLADAPRLLRELYENLDGARPEMSPPAVFLVGWSGAAERFQAHYLAVEDDFEPMPIHGLHVMPAPITSRPTALELNRARAEFVGQESSNFWTEWAALPELPVPETAEDWEELGYQAQSRALIDLVRTLVGGRLFLTTLKRGSSTTTQLLEFDDPDDFKRMVAGSQHPLAQGMPCHCGSDKTFLNCHLAEHYADGHPCDCGSGDPFTECCQAPSPAG